MLKLFIIIISLAIPGVAWCKPLSTEMMNAIQAEDRGDAVAAQKHFLSAILIGNGSSVTTEEVVEAKYRMFGLSHRTGMDFKTAMQFLVSAAEAGHPAAQKHLSYLITLMYKDRPDKNVLAVIGHRYDMKDSVRFLKSAANSGHYPAIIQLAKNYEKGLNGALLDPAYAEDLESQGVAIALQAADLGDAEAAEDLARYALSGIGMSKSQSRSFAFAELATTLWEKKALEGSVEAKRQLMMRLAKGEGGNLTPQTGGNAEYWALAYLRGAQTYNALTRVARYYADDKFGSNKEVLAHALYNVASTLNQGKYASEKRDEIAERMTEEQVQISITLARTCVESGLIECMRGF